MTLRAARRLRARRQILGLGAALMVALAVSAVFSVRPLVSGDTELRELEGNGAAMRLVGDLRTTLANWQLFIEARVTKLTPDGTKLDPNDLATGTQLLTTEKAEAHELATALHALGQPILARDIESSDAAFQQSVSDLTPLLSGASAATIAAVVGRTRAGFARMWNDTARAAAQLADMAKAYRSEADDDLGTGRKIVLLIDGLFAVVVVAGTVVLGQRARRREIRQRRVDERRTFEAELQQALDMAKSESSVFDVLSDALPEAMPGAHVEILVADSSRAHFHRVLSTIADDDECSGCPVVAPQDCPATLRAQTLLFPTSRAINACPNLKHRPAGDCSAACIPLSLAGRTIGVLHAPDSDRRPPDDAAVEMLEIAARLASERLAMVRAFERSEEQARSDPLTGLWNRRSVENRVRELYDEDVPYTLAYGDLDHFKQLNDTHSHEAGDQALRLFSRVMRDSVRPNDLVSRYGGEEFVVVLPDCDVDGAVAVLERVRERLALALTSGKVPAFTASFGLASSTQHETFAGTLAAADRALLAAKAAGRNRVMVSDGFGGEARTALPAEGDAAP